MARASNALPVLADNAGHHQVNRSRAYDAISDRPLAECAGERAQQLWTLKQPTRGVLRVQWRKPTDQEETSLALEHGIGIFVEKVLPGGPSEKSGLAAGDAIATIDGRPISRAALTPSPNKKGSAACSRYMPSVGLTVRVPCDEYIEESK